MERGFVPVRNRSISVRVPLSDILYIERNLRKIKLVTTEDVFEFYSRLEQIIPYLDHRFYPALAGLYINFDRVLSMTQRNVCFDNGWRYPLARDCFIHTRNRFDEYMRMASNV